MLGLGGIASWALAAHTGPDTTPAAPPPATLPGTTGSAAPGSAAPPTSRPPASRPHSPTQAPSPSSASPSPSRVRGHPGDTQVEKGSLWSDGSIEVAGTDVSESTVTLKAEADLTALDLTIRVVMTPGLGDQGATHDVTGGAITATVERRSGALLYHFVLREGTTLPAGTYRFTARYGHDGAGRDATDDTYEAFATDADRRRPHVYGNFDVTD
ncbi:hypothetical protein [Phytohabitans rumicis]|uniref:hypothetical protein n=1 Tax=Phytohabitans rumicis TaxID=1076125 RepID=UPI001566B796|nr:hypothetical protein [Phytohabitans rumicis]